MSNSKTRVVIASLALVVGAGVMLGSDRRVEACGPDFPTNMLIRRADALATMWGGSFAEEAANLVPVSARDRELVTQTPALVIATPREHALYAAAAAKFHAGDREGAAKGFEALLRLPANERKRLSVAAAYSLGRAHYSTWNDAKAIAAFRQVRELVRAGFVDDHSLAIDSLGEEARATARLDSAHTETVSHWTRGIRLYAQQAALGSPSGATSLLEVVRATDAADRAILYRDDVGTSLLALYYYTRQHELSDLDRTLWKKELARAVTKGTRGAAYMAAASYREGDWAAASAFANLSRAPIATWVRAKLALRDGDRARAESLLREVERAGLRGSFSDPSYEIDENPSSLVRAELGLLALASDRFTEAAEWFSKGERAVEAGYVMDHAMSMDELLGAVQHSRAMRDTPAAQRMLEIYARRLLRAHRYDEALEAYGAEPPEAAKTFVAAMTRAARTTGIERAEHLFAASRTLREHGMEIAGTEVGPDWRIYDGGYEREMLCMPSPVHGYTRFATRDEDGWYRQDDELGCALPSQEDAAYVSPLEAARVRASAPEVPTRFSYRYAAANLAEEAAGLVPPRSQAYASLLCWAARYASRDRARVEELYEMYVRNGAAGFEIGSNCAEPDFGRARDFDDEQARLRANEVAARARWTWPRIRDAAWRRRGWLVYPLAATLLFLLARFALARAAYTPGFARDRKR